MKSEDASARNWAILLAAFLLAAVRPVTAAETLTLDDYFARALVRSEVVATQSELIQQAEERYRQAGAALRPTIDGVGSYTWLDKGARDTAVNPTRQPHARLTATQPLFRGFREFATLRQTQALMGAQGDDYRQARTQLFKDVAQNFYDVLSLEQDLNNLHEQINQNFEREKELRDRVRIGRSRAGEMLTVQSTISTLRAQVEQLQAQLSTAREAFAFLSGLPAGAPLHDSEVLPTNLDTLETYLARLELRPDVKAAQQRLTAAQENISVARGAYRPSLDLNANRYLERKGNLEDVDWDVQLALTIPLYAGGSLQSRVREAVSQSTQAELGASQVRRLAEQEIRSAYRSVAFDRTQIEALEGATEAARKNYEVQRRDYSLGLVTNLEVLQALTAFQENQRALDRARYTAKLNYLKLEAAAVRRPTPPEGTAP
ncbi:MAG: TolC family protein [Sulfuricaulis sp.]|nr:TolC family protein [Sulfuricaulis sp.]